MIHEDAAAVSSSKLAQMQVLKVNEAVELIQSTSNPCQEQAAEKEPETDPGIPEIVFVAAGLRNTTDDPELWHTRFTRPVFQCKNRPGNTCEQYTD
jgi:hypothetical protein